MIHHVVKKRFVSDQKHLQVIADEVLKSIPHPFGSFKKAKYVLKSYKKDLYYFTTTNRNTEECLEIMKNKFNHLGLSGIYYTVIKVQNNKSEILFSNKQSWNGHSITGKYIFIRKEELN